MRVDLEPCYVLHSHPYRNSSLIIELLTKHYGRIAAVARSARGPKSRYRGCLQPFIPLLISWSGRKELMQLGTVELTGIPYPLNGKALMSGFYLNELLIRLLPRQDEYPLIFDQYQQVLEMFVAQKDLQQSLRLFEKQLLASLGYGFTLRNDYQGNPIEEQAWYQLIPNQGLARCSLSTAASVFCGRSILALHYNQLDDEQKQRDAKHLMRLALAHYLGSKPLKSRELIKSMYQKVVHEFELSDCSKT